MLFLFTQRQVKAEYDFIPYRLGCYSFSVNADLTTMVKKGILSETTTHFRSNETVDYIQTLKEADRKLLQEIKSRYGKMDARALMKHTYINFPYWGINSIKAKEILSIDEFERIKNSKPQNEKTILYTIDTREFS